jgi:Arc/MetJ family transcription regulator
MARTVIDIDESLLALAAAELGTSSKRQTVEYALRRIAAPRAIRELGELIAARGKTAKELDSAVEELWRRH